MLNRIDYTLFNIFKQNIISFFAPSDPLGSCWMKIYYKSFNYYFIVAFQKNVVYDYMIKKCIMPHRF